MNVFEQPFFSYFADRVSDGDMRRVGGGTGVTRKAACAAFAAMVAAWSPHLLAQWPRYSMRNIPKTADGKPDLNAPAPRTPEGKPDLSGTWDTVPCLGCAVPVIDGLTPPPAAQGRGGAAGQAAAGGTPTNGGPAGQAGAPNAPSDAGAANRARGGGATNSPAGSGAAQPSGSAAAGQGRGNAPGPQGGNGTNRPRFRSVFADIGSDVPGGAPYLPWAADLVKKRVADNSKDNPDAHCLPMGITQLNAHPYPRKIVQTRDEILIIYEGSGTTVREIFLDGRPLPNKDDVEPWWNGYSVGHWEGDTLVIETTGLMDDGWLDVRGSPLTDAAKITEQFRRVNFGYLELKETIDDSKAYSKPFTATINYRISPDTQLIEFVCIDKDAQHYVGGAAKK